MRAVFMGTPDTAVPSLRELAKACDVVAVYTRPDSPRGRGRKMEASPVKEEAARLGIEVVEAAGLRGEVQRLAGFRPDVVCVVAYGAILPPEVLEVPVQGCVNVHFSLLPRWRGAAPVERSILAGDERTGVVTMLMDEGLDTGPLLRAREIRIDPQDTAGSLRRRLAELGAGLLRETLADLPHLTPVAQDESKATSARKIEPADAALDPSGPAEMLERCVRAMSPKPGAFLEFRGKRLKVWRAEVVEGAGEEGRIGAVGRPGVDVQTSRDRLRLLEVQPEGKRRMNVAAFIAGYRPAVGEESGARV